LYENICGERSQGGEDFLARIHTASGKITSSLSVCTFRLQLDQSTLALSRGVQLFLRLFRDDRISAVI
jgi:hypothetical protein